MWQPVLLGSIVVTVLLVGHLSLIADQYIEKRFHRILQKDLEFGTFSKLTDNVKNINSIFQNTQITKPYLTNLAAQSSLLAIISNMPSQLANEPYCNFIKYCSGVYEQKTLGIVSVQMIGQPKEQSICGEIAVIFSTFLTEVTQ